MNLKRLFAPVLLLIIITLAGSFILPFKETLSCHKSQNLCEDKVQYFFKDTTQNLTLSDFDGIDIERYYADNSHYYSLVYKSKYGFNMDIFTTSYQSSEGAEEAKIQLINFLNSKEESLVIEKYNVLFLLFFLLFLITPVFCLLA